MTDSTCRIICASAGTGKTYRLSLEYLALILQFYGKPDFSLDSILVLTFTRKATSEIRERIVSQLSMLCSDLEPEKKSELVKNLRKLVPSAETELSDRETNLLLSAKNELTCDKSRMQVMTIDAYINHIFRNIVRPLRNIERYDIDTEAVDKRMPYLLDHLMKPEYRERMKRLLTRKLSRSLDDYRAFFGSLVKQRWLYYLITGRPQTAPSGLGQKRLCDYAVSGDPQASLEAFHFEMQIIIDQLDELCRIMQKAGFTDLFNSDFRNLLMEGTPDPALLMQRIKELSPEKLEKLLGILTTKKVWNGTRIKAKTYPVQTARMQEAVEQARVNLADYLLGVLYLPEQSEILELWGVILKEYDRLIYRYKNLTYDDISWFCFEALFSQDPPFMNPESAVSATEFYQFLSHRTRFLLIDEFQDTSLIQFNILKPIIEEITAGEGSKPFGGLIVVGDEKQSIFGWRGGERDLLLNLQVIFPAISEVHTERLEVCWRCGPTLMQFINSVFQNPGIHNFLHERQMSWEYSMITSANPVKLEPGTTVEFCLNNYSSADSDSSSSKEMIADFVNRMVRPALKEDKSGSIAILCRKGKELEEVQQALDEAGITSLYQPDRSIIEHRLVSPLLAWLRYLAWGDWMDFLAFLRSDYLRLKTPILKAVLKVISLGLEQSRECYSEPDFSAIPVAEQLRLLSLEHKNMSPTRICRVMAEGFLHRESTSERDYLNLHKWLDLVAMWELNSSESSLPDLLIWAKENSAADDFKQVSVSGEDSLQLLTFHKSKGLQFRRVFVYYNLSGGHRDSNRYLQWAVQYAGKDFQNLMDFGISYHYQKILKASSYAQLWKAEENRELLEEMNNLYVAFTRSEKKLHLYFCYNGKITWQEYLQKHEEDKLPVLVCNAVKESFGDIEPDQRGFFQKLSMFAESKPEQGETPKAEPEPQTTSALPCRDGLPEIVHHRMIDLAAMLPADRKAGVNFKQQWLETKPNLKGDLLHLYLSFILRNTEQEHDHAYLRCILRFGAIFTRAEIDDLVIRGRKVCAEHAWLFALAWDKVFTEQEIYHAGKSLRLDRLMVNSAAKRAMIVDYKSGEIHDVDQLATYQMAISSLPALQDFLIDTEIVYI